MKILFVGTFLKPNSTHHFLVKELKKKNHEVTCFDFRHVALKNMKLNLSFYSEVFKKYFEIFFRKRLFLPQKIRNIKYYLFGNWRMNSQLFDLIKNNNFDLIFLAKVDSVNFTNIPKFNKYSRTWFYFMDPMRVAYIMHSHKYAALSTLSSATTNAMTKLFKKEGGNSYYILEGYDPNLFFPRKEKKSKEIDVIFVGGFRNDRKNYINYLRRNKINVVCYGKGWENKPIYFENLVNEYRKSKIVLNFPKVDSGFSDRVFQVLGTGTFLLSKYCSDLPRMFKKGIHMDWFETPEEFLKLIKFYLENKEVREKVAQEGNRYAINNFTWEKCVEKIISIINNDEI